MSCLLQLLFCLLEMKLLLIVFCVSVVTFATSEENSNFIVGGENALVSDYPYMAGVLNFGLPSCGGSIITARSVLTVLIFCRGIECKLLRNILFKGCTLFHH
jgi:secreted trypsin-like serine protease